MGSVATTCTAATRIPLRISAARERQLDAHQHVALGEPHRPGGVDRARVDLADRRVRGEEDRRQGQQRQGDEDRPGLESPPCAQRDRHEQTRDRERGDRPADVDRPGGGELAAPMVGEDRGQRHRDQNRHAITTATQSVTVSPSEARIPPRPVQVCSGENHSHTPMSRGTAA